MTRPEPWKNFANQRVDDIRMDAVLIISIVKPLLDHGDLEVVQRASKVIEKQYGIIRLTDEIKNVNKR